MSAPITQPWPSKIKLRNGAKAQYLGICPVTGRHRVLDPTRGQNGTVWLLDDCGRARGDLAPSDVDFTGEAA